MKHRTPPSPQDYDCLHRALRGTLVTVLLFMLSVIVLEFPWFDAQPAQFSFCLVYCFILMVGFIWAWRSDFRPRTDLTGEELARVSTHGPRLCLLIGIGVLTAAIGMTLCLDRVLSTHAVCMILLGLSLIFWAFQFPKVSPHPNDAKRWQFSLRALLIATLLCGIYMGLVVWLTSPDDHIVIRLLQPFLSLVLLGLACYLIQVAWILIRLICFSAKKIVELLSPRARLDADPPDRRY